MRNLLKHMSIYGLGGVLSKTINYLLVPVYTRVLAPADYGTLDLVYMVGSLIAILYGFMIGSGYVRNYYSYPDDKDREALLGSAFWFTAISSVFFFLGTYIFSKEIAGTIFRFENGTEYLVYICGSTVFSVLSVIFYSHLMVTQKPRSYVTVNVISLLITISLTIWFVVVLRWSVAGVLYAQILGRGIELLILGCLILRRSIFRVSAPFVIDMLKYSIPLIPVQLSAFTLTLSNRFFLQEYTTLADVGLFALASKLASVLQLFAIEPLRGFTPFIFSLVPTPEKCKRTLADFVRIYILVIHIITLGIAMFSREMILIMADPGYYSSWKIVYWLTLGYSLYGTVVLSSYTIEIVKKNWISSFAWILGAILNVILNILLIPPFGITGAAFATLFSYFLVLIGYWIVTKIVYPVPYKYPWFAAVILLGTGVYLLSTLIQFGFILSILLKGLLLLAFIAVILISGYLNEEETKKIKSILPLVRQTLGKRFASGQFSHDR